MALLFLFLKSTGLWSLEGEAMQLHIPKVKENDPPAHLLFTSKPAAIAAVNAVRAAVTDDWTHHLEINGCASKNFLTTVTEGAWKGSGAVPPAQ